MGRQATPKEAEMEAQKEIPELVFKCRKCGVKNPAVYWAPLYCNDSLTTCVCEQCVVDRNWIDRRTGALREGVSL